eukprot:CAMPEP_0204041052 /NCGR_PEP_ID=MMETSP0360-20130528/93129_1 /ASSEMBLY_ACC=CAM_ASM_000342 /TAXON_ID=268821 /ORGANISM="Scrippsiella Hangoei, Strain SHTV-5" /LENGTH=87 /DNA_ID=CAMNT_0050987145 /DNA_START=31 /DNA_END=292 /DNA_ORIENTATION=-
MTAQGPASTCLDLPSGAEATTGRAIPRHPRLVDLGRAVACVGVPPAPLVAVLAAPVGAAVVAAGVVGAAVGGDVLGAGVVVVGAGVV